MMSSFFFKFIYYIYSILRILSACMPAGHKRAPDLITDGCEPPCGCWELNSGPLEEQAMLLTSEPSLQPIDFGFLRQGFSVEQLWLFLNSLGRPGWPQTHQDPPVSASRVLGLKVCNTTAQHERGFLTSCFLLDKGPSEEPWPEERPAEGETLSVFHNSFSMSTPSL